MSSLSGTLNPFIQSEPRLNNINPETENQKKLNNKDETINSLEEKKKRIRTNRTSLLSGGDGGVDTFNQRIITG